jgi:hypothetical protein
MSKLGITRLPGESEADFQRRYHREKVRIYRARKPKSTRKRGKGKGPAANGRFTQAEWEALQRRPDETADGHQRRYKRERMRLLRARPGTLERQSELARKRYAEDAAYRESEKARKAANPERSREYSRRHFQRNREERLAILRDWRARNPGRVKAAGERHRAANPGLYASYSAKWRAAARVATPPWADEKAMRAIYAEAARVTAETGEEHHVDHIVPLRGKNVCGLHVQTNLRVLPGLDNSRKHNAFDEALVLGLMWADIDVI